MCFEQLCLDMYWYIKVVYLYFIYSGDNVFSYVYAMHYVCIFGFIKTFSELLSKISFLKILFGILTILAAGLCI